MPGSGDESMPCVGASGWPCQLRECESGASVDGCTVVHLCG